MYVHTFYAICPRADCYTEIASFVNVIRHSASEAQYMNLAAFVVLDLI